jgi:hypothetical protein
MRTANRITRKRIARQLRNQETSRKVKVCGKKGERWKLMAKGKAKGKKGTPIVIGPLNGFPTMASAQLYSEHKTGQRASRFTIAA